MSDKQPEFLDLPGLQTYHDKVVRALNEKAHKTYVGETQPTDPKIETWLLVETEDEAQSIDEPSLVSEEEEELTFADEEELTFNEDIE